MQLQIKGKNLEVSESIRDYAERKLAKLDRLVHDTTRVEIELAVERNPSVSDNQVAEATVRLKGHTLRAREASGDMKASIDELAEKLLRQVREEREKKDAKRRTADKHLAGEAQALEPRD
jgi:putative sigma-54 modulation protein